MDEPLPVKEPQPLRILAVINLPWDPRLGASRVWLELTQEWRATGHIVDKYSLDDAFPRPSKHRAVSALRQVMFSSRVAKHIRQHGDRYDIIDSHLGTLPFSKKRLRFKGLVVARSVGFYRLYEKFDIFARNRWPDVARGRLVGRLLYAVTKSRSLKAAHDAVGFADLINLANEDELVCLRDEVKSEKPAMVQPYGLNPAQADALAAAAAPADVRLAQRRISFVGAWSIRKGAKDWGRIVRRIRAVIPDAKFCFLGTMTEDATVQADLALDDYSGIELVREYKPGELPQLLANCTLGVFPSYVEGFGLGLLEQLACGLPAIAYDAPGPRQILRPLHERALVPLGDADALAARAIEILQLDGQAYQALREETLAIAAPYSWPKIAADTLRVYRRMLRAPGTIVFTYPFGLRSAGGGARIMRALLQDAPDPVMSICTSPERPPPGSFATELHLPLRPSFGRIERTRFARLAHATAPLFARRFVRGLEDACVEARAAAIHSVAHAGMDFHFARVVAKKLGIPFLLHVHDDFVYSARGHLSERGAHAVIGEAWQTAAARFVICSRLGEEYCRRYGKRDYTIVTDGLERVAPAPVRLAGRDLRIYFMGLFHLEYEENLRILLMALAQLRAAGKVGNASVTLRCGGLRPSPIRGYEDLVHVLPFGSEADVESDLARADLLYLPLPFEKKYDSFVRFSLSTKMVTYIGSGIPIFYHGPKNSAVHDLLSNPQAALESLTREPQKLAEALQQYVDAEEVGVDVARHALELAQSDFMLRDIRKKFWGSVDRSLTE